MLLETEGKKAQFFALNGSKHRFENDAFSLQRASKIQINPMCYARAKIGTIVLAVGFTVNAQVAR
jgi:hypothetical protein